MAAASQRVAAWRAGIFWSAALGLCRGRALFLQTTIEEQGLLSHTLQQWQSGFLRLGRRGEPLDFLRQRRDG